VNPLWKLQIAPFYYDIHRLSQGRGTKFTYEPVKAGLCSPVRVVKMITNGIKTVKEFHLCQPLCVKEAEALSAKLLQILTWDIFHVNNYLNGFSRNLHRRTI